MRGYGYWSSAVSANTATRPPLGVVGEQADSRIGRRWVRIAFSLLLAPHKSRYRQTMTTKTARLTRVFRLVLLLAVCAALVSGDTPVRSKSDYPAAGVTNRLGIILSCCEP